MSFYRVVIDRASLWQDSRPVLGWRQRRYEIQDWEMFQDARLYQSRECMWHAVDTDVVLL